jgi:hypothetical protein
MLRKIGLRRSLPILNLALYIASMCLGYAVQPHLTSQSAAQIHSAESGTVPNRIKFAVALNVPAVLAALFLNAMIFRFQSNHVLLLAAPFVPMLWYSVGRWFDQRLGWVQRGKSKSSFLGDTLLILCGLLAIFSVVTLLQTIKRAYTPDSLWLVFGVCTWFAFLLVVLARIFHARFFRGSDVAGTQATP